MKSPLDDITDFQPQWSADGLIPVIAQDINDSEVKMMAWMNEEALKQTLKTGYVHYWARSRSKIWKKGEESGHLQKLIEIRVDCDQDCLLVMIEQEGPACHTNRANCFYRKVEYDKKLKFIF
jgi:phosphoribosyl-AMP cyclohydrolase